MASDFRLLTAETNHEKITALNLISLNVF